jgi:hypothetical protein
VDYLEKLMSFEYIATSGILFLVPYFIMGYAVAKECKKYKCSKLARLGALFFWPLILVYIVTVSMITSLIEVFKD